jgi:hypothetical protein
VEIRLSRATNGTLRRVHQEESAVHELGHVAAWPTHLPKDVKKAVAKIIGGIGVEVAPSRRWRDPDEEDSQGIRRLVSERVQVARRALDACRGQLSQTSDTSGDVALETRPAVPHDPDVR